MRLPDGTIGLAWAGYCLGLALSGAWLGCAISCIGFLAGQFLAWYLYGDGDT